jgi:transglutaminase-like putative cysteine protease
MIINRIKQWISDNAALLIWTTLVICSLAAGLTESRLLRSVAVLWLAALGAVALGAPMGRLSWRGPVAALISMITGLLFSVQYHSGALPPIGAGTRELAVAGHYAGIEAIRPLVEATRWNISLPIFPEPTFPEWLAARERLNLYGWNLQAGWPPEIGPQHLLMGQTLLGTILGALVWMVTAMLVWAVARRGMVWPALLPILILLAASAYFTARGWSYLVLGLFSGLMLMSQATHWRLAGRWNEDLLPYGLALDRFFWSLLITGTAAIAMLGTIWATDPKTRRWIDDTLFPEREVVTTNTGSGGGTAPSTRYAGVLPTQHLLGSGPELSERVVMRVQTPGLAQAGFAWRSSSYDEYTGQGWIANYNDRPAPEVELWPASAEPPDHFALVRQTFRLEGQTLQIYAAGRPVRLNQPSKGMWLLPARQDLIGVQGITGQSAYEVLSWVPTATPDELREVPFGYPEWIQEAYMTLPGGLPKRVVGLSREVIRGQTNAFDRAMAIQQYLRTNFDYTLELEAPPSNVDVVDYFLFDLKRGYCDYFASAMVMMARSAGLPARLAVGFTSGEYNPELLQYRVSAANAHAWPEIYFPGYGWIPFEPTPGLPEITYGPTTNWSAEAAASQSQNIEEFDAVGVSSAASLPVYWPTLWALAAVAIVAGTAYSANAYQRWKLSRGTPDQVITAVYREFLREGQRLGVRASASETPHEFLRVMLRELEARNQHARHQSDTWASRYEQASQEADKLVALYVDTAYGPRRPERSSAEMALEGWWRLNRVLRAFWWSGLISGRRGKA